MGCKNGKVRGTPPGGKENIEGVLPGTLLDKYKLHEVLGQGTFGVVYRCEDIKTGEIYAVKMVDHVATPFWLIRYEVEILRKVKHERVVALGDVFHETVFVCLVFNLCKGGDLLKACESHWKRRGLLTENVSQHLMKMTMEGIAWIHEHNIVHRDIKPQNMLVNEKNVEDPECRIFLGDVGCAHVLKSRNERMTTPWGSPAFWSPEVLDHDYGMAMDIWGCGTMLYFINEGKVPFKTTNEIKQLQLTLSRVGADGESFFASVLNRQESDRLTAAQARQHTWLVDLKMPAMEVQPLGPGFEGRADDDVADAGAQRRREVMVERLEQCHMLRANSQLQTVSVSNFHFSEAWEVVNARAGFTCKLEWWPAAKVEAANFYDPSSGTNIEKPMRQESTSSFSRDPILLLFKTYDVDISLFGARGKSKSFADFAREINNGEARLMLDASKHKSLVRVVDVVLLRVVYGTGLGKKYLVKSTEIYPDGRERQNIDQLAGTKKLPYENGARCVQRLVKERMPRLEGHLQFNFSQKEYFEDDEDSPSYPGVRTVYRKSIYEATFTTEDLDILNQVGLAESSTTNGFGESDDRKYTRIYLWLDAHQCANKGITLMAPAHGHVMSTLVDTPAGYSEKDLFAFLAANNVDVSQFGQDGARSMAELSSELMKGESQLLKQLDGEVMRVVDVVILQIRNDSGHTLVEASQVMQDGKVKDNPRLPAVKRRADENIFCAAHRVISEVLKVDEDFIHIDETNVIVVEERTDSKTYAGVPTLYRRHIISALANKSQ